MKSKVGEKKLAVHPWTKEVNPNFYEDCTLTPRGKKSIEEMYERSCRSIQRKREKLQGEGKQIQQREGQIENRKEKFILRVKAFGERYEQPVYV